MNSGSMSNFPKEGSKSKAMHGFNYKPYRLRWPWIIGAFHPTFLYWHLICFNDNLHVLKAAFCFLLDVTSEVCAPPLPHTLSPGRLILHYHTILLAVGFHSECLSPAITLIRNQSFLSRILHFVVGTSRAATAAVFEWCLDYVSTVLTSLKSFLMPYQSICEYPVLRAIE